jgi:hypothetical protein
MDIEDSYVVRIYRRAPPSGKPDVHGGHPRLTGVVENPSTGQRRAFHDIEELWAVLTDTGSPALGRKQKPAPIET